jgi:hypothetical protein
MNTSLIEVLRRPVEFALHAPVAVMDQADEICTCALTRPDRLLERVQREIGAQRS